MRTSDHSVPGGPPHQVVLCMQVPHEPCPQLWGFRGEPFCDEQLARAASGSLVCLDFGALGCQWCPLVLRLRSYGLPGSQRLGPMPSCIITFCPLNSLCGPNWILLSSDLLFRISLQRDVSRQHAPRSRLTRRRQSRTPGFAAPVPTAEGQNPLGTGIGEWGKMVLGAPLAAHPAQLRAEWLTRGRTSRTSVLGFRHGCGAIWAAAHAGSSLSLHRLAA